MQNIAIEGYFPHIGSNVPNTSLRHALPYQRLFFLGHHNVQVDGTAALFCHCSSRFRFLALGGISCTLSTGFSVCSSTVFLRRCSLLFWSLIFDGAGIQHLGSGSHFFLGVGFYHGWSSQCFRCSFYHGNLRRTRGLPLQNRGRILDRLRLFLFRSLTGFFGLLADVPYLFCHGVKKAGQQTDQ